jgi:hypothetical protein
VRDPFDRVGGGVKVIQGRSQVLQSYILPTGRKGSTNVLMQDLILIPLIPQRKRAMKKITPFSELNKWLPRIHEDIQLLLINRHVFRVTQAVIEANPRIQTHGIFLSWMARAYANDQMVGVRRQIDGRGDVVSLLRLLGQIKKNPQLLTRERFVSRYKVEHYPYAHKTFDKIAGLGQDCINAAMMEEDLKKLKDTTRNLQTYINQEITHIRDKPVGSVPTLPKLPTFAELDECLDLIESLLRKYRFLLYGIMEDILPVFLSDWTQIFREPWVPCGKSVPEMKEKRKPHKEGEKAPFWEPQIFRRPRKAGQTKED